MKIIARIETDFPTKFGIPRQSGLVSALKGRIVFEKEFCNFQTVRGLEKFSHIWVLWQFSENVNAEWSPMVKPPRLGGNMRMGVFATRSPFRPNSIGLSCVRLERIEFDNKEGPVLHVSGVDMMNGTPIYDIKPYVAYTDSHPDAVCGFADEVYDENLEVIIPDEWLMEIPEEQRDAVFEILCQDPRPHYQKSSNRIYGVEYAGMDIRFTVEENVLTVVEVIRVNTKGEKYPVRYKEE